MVRRELKSLAFAVDVQAFLLRRCRCSVGIKCRRIINTNAINEMLKRFQKHDKKKYVIPNLFRNLKFGNDNELIASVLIS